MRKIPQCIKGTVAILVLFYAWSYAIEVDSMYYPENNHTRHTNAHSPDHQPEYGLCYACDAELTPDGDMYEPDLICPNHKCDQSPYYVEDSND